MPLFTAFLSVTNLKLRASISVAAFRLLKLAAKNEEKKGKSHLNTLYEVTSNRYYILMQKNSIALKENEGIPALCSSKLKKGEQASPDREWSSIPVTSTTHLRAKELPLSFQEGLGLQYQLYLTGIIQKKSQKLYSFIFTKWQLQLE